MRLKELKLFIISSLEFWLISKAKSKQSLEEKIDNIPILIIDQYSEEYNEELFSFIKNDKQGEDQLH